MSNEVIKETEETATAATSVKEETKSPNAAELADEEQSASEMDFGAILEQFEQEQTLFSSGELVQGKVVGISERGILVDFGYKSEGIVPREEFTSPTGEITVKVGDEVEVVIRSMDSNDHAPSLSYLDAIRRKSWSTIEEAYKNGTPVIGHVVEKTKGGLKVEINGVEAFLPGSQVDSRPIRNLDPFIGQEIETKIIKFSRKRNNIVLSRKVLTDEVVNAQKSETLANLEEGFVVEGKVKSLTEYGAFVDLGGIDGLLHVTDMSWGRLQNPNQLFKVNDSVQVKVLKLDREKEKVSLGYKQLLPDPWATVAEVYPVSTKQKGKVSSVTDYGAFIELEPGVEGLVHVTEMSWSKRAKHPKNLVEVGDEVDVQVLGIDTRDRRISLGMKQLMPNPWDSIDERYQVGTRVVGKVRNLTDFGAFIEVEDGVDGLVHVSDISWSKKIKHPKEALKKGQEVEAVVTSIDTHGRRLSLSIKELSPSAWDSFTATHRVGDIVKGKISRFVNFGVFVELAGDLEGLCHISELSDERIDRPEEVVSLGQEMDFRILRIENDVQKIGLSARAVGRDDEPIIDTKVYSTEAKGGMASLAELANLKFGREPEEAKAEPKEEQKADNDEISEPQAEAAPAEDAPADESSVEETPVETPAEVADADGGEIASATDELNEAEDAEAEPIEQEATEGATAEAPAESATEEAAETTEEAADESEAGKA
jgi:small subunit ribosomal protein S1